MLTDDKCKSRVVLFKMGPERIQKAGLKTFPMDEVSSLLSRSRSTFEIPRVIHRFFVGSMQSLESLN